MYFLTFFLSAEESKIILKTFGELLIFSGKVTRHLRVRETVASTLANLSLNGRHFGGTSKIIEI